MGGAGFANPEWVHLVWPALALTAVLGWLEARGRGRLGRFVAPAMQGRLARGASPARRGLRVALMGATLLLGVGALMRPQTPGGVEVVARTPGADIVVALDVSRSMLAEDAAPNRLARARADIREFLDRVGGHRVGLVAFAGRASVMCPLTTDYGYFHLVLKSVGTGSVARGGTRIGDGIRKAVDAFGPNRGAPRLLLLITDGEDHDSFPLDAATEAAEAGVRIAAIGFGSEAGSEVVMTDPDTGARTVVRDDHGAPVRSRLDGALLRDIALETDGVYVPAGTSAIDIEAIVEAHVEPLVVEADAGVRRRAPREHYFWLVLAALGCLLAAVWAGAPGLGGGPGAATGANAEPDVRTRRRPAG